MPKRAKSKRLAAVAMNSMAQQAVPKGIGHRELARAQLTRSSSRVSSQLGLWPATSVVSTTCFMIQPRRVKGVRRNLSVPFQRPPFPDVDVAHGENQDEHQHLHDQEPRSEEHTSELQSRLHLVCRLLLEKKKSPRSRCSG